jgi:outer membrane protein
MKAKMKTKWKILITFLFLIPLISSGQSLSLKQCIDYANENHGRIKIASMDEETSTKRVNEQISVMLPQINFSGSVDNNLKLSSQLLPGELLGQPGVLIPITFGTKFNLAAGLQLNQKIYDPGFLPGLKTAKLGEVQSEYNTLNTREQIAYSISRTYYQTLIIQKQLNTLQAILAASKKSLESTELKFQNGLARQLDIDKIRVSYNNTSSQVKQAELNYNQSLNNLKYQTGISLDRNITLSDTAFSAESEFAFKRSKDENYIENRIDYKMQKLNIELQEANREKSIFDFMPSLSFYAKYNYQAMRKEFDFFEKGKDWYDSYSIGLSLSIPVFDGLRKVNLLQESKLDVQKAEENLKLTEQSISLEVSNYDIQYNNAVDNLINEKDSYLLAKRVYQNTQMEYENGRGSSYDLVQAESSLRESQNNYYNKLLTLYIARIELEKSKGTLINFINNLK